MGSMLSQMSFELAIEAGIALAGVVVFGYITYSKSHSGALAPTGGGVAKGKKKKKKIQIPKTGISELSEKPVSTTSPTATTATITQGNSVPEPEPIVVPFPHVIMPGEFEAMVPSADDRGAHATKSKGKKKKQKKHEEAPRDIDRLASRSGGDSTAPRKHGTTTLDVDMPSKSLKEEEEELRIRSSSPSVDTDSSWTRIDHQRRTVRPRGAKLKAAATGLGDQELAIRTDLTTGSDVGPSTGDSSVAERMGMEEDVGAVTEAGTSASRHDNNRRTLAEKLLPKPRKTAVDDMLERPDYPGLARVMRVQPRADEAPAPGFSWKDYEDVDDGSGKLNDGDDGDGEWGIVKGKSRPSSKDVTMSSPQVVQKAPEQLTQKQRQNAKRNQLLKAAKAEAEAERLVKLAEHKRALERERIIEQSRRGASKASVDSRGKLVFD
ncbi:hypothetical protein AZE42_07751 [Rhizopogon vesiculosus]|uniref:Uncharacterized protein n=1 Tax=Rhizopogon vesiculosus TaxID=180088 RepID=A0A1J8PPU8_9AGAM|nr:hypothetical protein AZE42_07751 [Rhizopogon vesiculosus]